MTSAQGRLCSTHLEANAGLMAERVPTNNQRGRRSGPCRLWGGLDKARHIVPAACTIMYNHNLWYVHCMMYFCFIINVCLRYYSVCEIGDVDMKHCVLIHFWMQRNCWQCQWEFMNRIIIKSMEASMCHVVCFCDLVVTRSHIVITRCHLVNLR